MKNGARTMLLLAGDIAMLLIAFWAMLYIYISLHVQVAQSAIGLHALPFSILAIFWIIIFFIFNLYNTEASRPTIPHLRQMFFAFIVAVAAGAIFFYTIPVFKIAPKTNLLIFGAISFVLFNIWRRIFYNIFASHFRKDVVFIVEDKKNSREVDDLRTYITKHPQSGFVVRGVYDTFDQFLEKHGAYIPQVFIVSKEVWRSETNFKRLYETKSEILDLAYAYEDILGRIPIEAIDEGWFIHNVRSHEKKIYDFLKEIIGVIIAALTFIIISPLILVIAILIKFGDGGPILYSQIRIGKDEKEFRLYKFRSMIMNAEENGAEWSIKSDPRVTAVGKILRKLHVDELPQMINIIRGDIALVGPRPERPEFVEKLEKEIPFYHLRHIVSPGFTGWAQIKFRYAGNVMDSREKFEYDLYYLKNRNSFMDFGIILRTIQIIFTH